MVNRINLLLKAKNITARQFAEEIGIQPSGMSHILSGRNNPSLDFVMKVIRRYPEIDINWLMFGKGEMYEAHPRVASYRTTPPTPMSTAAPTKPVTVQTTVVKQSEAIQGDLFGQPAESRINESRLTRNDRDSSLLTSMIAPEEATENRTNAMRSSQPVAESMPDSVEPVRQASYPSEGVSPMVSPTHSGISPTSDTVATPQQARKLVRLLAFYDDHTFVEYRPQ